MIVGWGFFFNVGFYRGVRRFIRGRRFDFDLRLFRRILMRKRKESFPYDDIHINNV